MNNITAKLKLLNNRITEARIINLEDQPKDEIRFGATVTLKTEGTNEMQTFQVVGVDEANISRGKISFLSPLARVLTNKKVGDKVVLKRPKGDRVFDNHEYNLPSSKLISLSYSLMNFPVMIPLPSFTLMK